MRLLLLPFLLLPLSSFAQYRPIHSPTPSSYQVQQRQQQAAQQNYQRQQAQIQQNYQQSRQMHQRMFQNQQQSQQQMMLNQQQMHQQQMFRNQQQMQQQMMWLGMRNQQQLEQDQEKQQQAEQQANEQVAQLAQEQQRKRQENPAQDAQQAMAQQKEDTKQLILLTVKNFRKVFLPGLVTSALQNMMLAPKAQQELDNVNKDLRDKSWWSKQDPAQVHDKITAYSNTLVALTSELLAFDISVAPPAVAPTSGSNLNDRLAKDEFDQAAATQIIRDASLAERIIAGERLAKAAMDFKRMAINLAVSKELQADPEKQRSAVKASLRKFNQEMLRYNARIGSAGKLYEAQKAISKSTADYLAKNEK